MKKINLNILESRSPKSHTIESTEEMKEENETKSNNLKLKFKFQMIWTNMTDKFLLPKHSQ